MDRNEFVSTLRAALTGEVSPAAVEDNVRYYQNYISQEIASGKSEKEVLEELGDPRLIARTIIDTQGNDGYGSDPTYTYYEEEPEAKKGFHAEFNDDGGIDIKYKRFNFNTWYGKLLVAVVIILILVLIGAIVGGILSLVLPVLIPVVIVLFLVRLIMIIFGDRW